MMSVTATAVGFVGRPEDMRDRVRLCRPVLSLDAQRDEVLLARRLDWGTAERGLKKLDRDELARAATLCPVGGATVRTGDGIVVMGSEFVRAVEAAKLGEVGNLSFQEVLGCDYRVAISSVADFECYVDTLVQAAMSAFDGDLMLRTAGRLSQSGSGALFLLKRAPLQRDIAIVLRQLAGAYVEHGQSESYDRLLSYFALDLKVTAAALDAEVQQRLGRSEPLRELIYEIAPSEFSGSTSALFGEFVVKPYAGQTQSWPFDRVIDQRCDHTSVELGPDAHVQVIPTGSSGDEEANDGIERKLGKPHGNWLGAWQHHGAISATST